MRRLRILAFAALAAAGCGSIILGGGSEPTGPNEVLRGATFDQAWRATIETLADLRTPIDELERESGLVITEWALLRNPDTYMNCPGNARRNAEVRSNIFVRETGDGVRVTVLSTFRAQDEAGQRVTCSSETEYERMVLRRIRERV